MKIVFFRQLLLDDCTSQWTPAQQIVYSHLLSQSILRLDSVFHADGTNIDFVEVITEYCDEQSEIDLCDYKVSNLIESLNLSKQTIYDSVDFLREQGYINGECIYCPEEIIYRGFFELRTKTKLTKQLLIFYSWLYDRGEEYNFIVDTYCYKMSEYINIREETIRVMLHRLADKGFVKRLRREDNGYGKLLILPQENT